MQVPGHDGRAAYRGRAQHSSNPRAAITADDSRMGLSLPPADCLADVPRVPACTRLPTDLRRTP
ncbi:hypothetical protein XFF6166_50012 [Xanthomonas citri pv. fuscans]|nr:hypothetical protein XAB3213_4140016 [Xanthomonas citri pv. bilvae]SON81297.1 hypothetical protein XFF6166_50012 [Xanthomonas citri pv. fuscans]SON96584.1 hypothetical protein XFF6990_340089 [Xanthomonas citri pv. fuscans]SON99058.1 hypothetical protein XFF6960_120012 [Xanthomonas citri pv. fuscans]SOO04025.1 hypothetical protein XFF7767_210039 [Xanthomonas citri pv. fuscans]